MMVKTSLKKFSVMVFNDGEVIFEEVSNDGENIFEEVFDDDEIKERSYLVIKA